MIEWTDFLVTVNPSKVYTKKVINDLILDFDTIKKLEEGISLFDTYQDTYNY